MIADGLAGHPVFFADSPDVWHSELTVQQPQSDVVSAILRAVRLDAALFYHAELPVPWIISSPRVEELAPRVLPAAEHLIIYHLFASGRGFAKLPESPRRTVEPGTIVMLPHGDAHDIGAGSDGRVMTAADMLMYSRANSGAVAPFGGEGQTTRLVCGYLVCEPLLAKQLLGGLERMITVNVRASETGQWLESSIRHSVKRMGDAGPAENAALTKLAEALFVETLRLYLDSLPASQTGWVAGVRDPAVGKALALIHAHPERSWTIADLAVGAGVSRSVLAERFGRFMGAPPMAYLQRWRLQLGAQLLATTNRGVAEIAAAVGYESEPAFNRAFKKRFGEPPARYRSQQKRWASSAV